MFGKTDKERYDQTIAHLKKVSALLTTDVEQKIGAKKDAASKEISLGGAGYWNSGTTEQHAAVRAYLLCLIAYFRPTHAQFDFGNTAALDAARLRLRGKSVQQVNEEILFFLPKPGASLADLASAAERVNQVTGTVDYVPRTRAELNVSFNPVCYHGVCTWLFAAGFVSKRWLAKEANTINAYNCNTYLGQGTEVDAADWGDIPAGYVWNIHKKGDQPTCHWGVSLGGGRAAACNNTDESPGLKLVYEPGGNTQYGKYVFTELCTVLNKNTKYQFAGADDPSGTNIVVRQINPMAANFY